jgi:hypothetical protein
MHVAQYALGLSTKSQHMLADLQGEPPNVNNYDTMAFTDVIGEADLEWETMEEDLQEDVAVAHTLWDLHVWYLSLSLFKAWD